MGEEGRFRIYLRRHSLPLAEVVEVSSSSCLMLVEVEEVVVVVVVVRIVVTLVVVGSSSGEETEGDSRSSDSGDKTGV